MRHKLHQMCSPFYWNDRQFNKHYGVFLERWSNDGMAWEKIGNVFQCLCEGAKKAWMWVHNDKRDGGEEMVRNTLKANVNRLLEYHKRVDAGRAIRVTMTIEEVDRMELVFWSTQYSKWRVSPMGPVFHHDGKIWLVEDFRFWTNQKRNIEIYARFWEKVVMARDESIVRGRTVLEKNL